MKDHFTKEEAEALILKAGGSVETFHKWMRGQTCPLVDGVMAYYPYDVNRFIKYKCDPKNEPVADFD
jgi:hypothetical protein